MIDRLILGALAGNDFGVIGKAAIGHAEVISHGEIFDGVRLRKGQVIAVVRHNARVLLSCERVILNVLQRLRKRVDIVELGIAGHAGMESRMPPVSLLEIDAQPAALGRNVARGFRQSIPSSM